MDVVELLMSVCVEGSTAVGELVRGVVWEDWRAREPDRDVDGGV